MTDNPQGSTAEYSDPQRTLSRRHAIGAVAAAVGGGTILTAATGDAAAADVSVDELTVDDATFTSDQVDPVADATVAYEYRSADANGLRLYLRIADTEVASKELSTSTDQADGTASLSGRVVDADAYRLGAFATDVGETISRDVDFTVGLEVLTNGTVVASDEATETATIEVTNPDDGEPYARVGGTITIRDASA